MNSNLARVLKAITAVGGMAIVVKMAVLGKDLVVSGHFGIGDDLDAFCMGFLLPSLLINVVAASFHLAFIPIYLKTLERDGREAAQALLGMAALSCVGFLVITMLAVAMAGPMLLPVMGSGFDAAKLALTQRLLYLLLPTVLMSGLSGLWGAVLNARERFAATSAASMAIPIASLAALLLFGRVWGISALAAGTLLGYLAELVILGCCLKKQGIAILPTWSFPGGAFRQVFGQFLPLLGGALLMSGSSFVDQVMAGQLPSGSVAALVYGYKIVALILNVGVVAFSTVVIPYFGRLAATRDWTGLQKFVRSLSLFILAAVIPVTFAGLVGSDIIVSVLFQRGKFTAANSQLVSNVQTIFLVQVPFYCLGILFHRLISCLQANWVLFYCSVMNLGLTIVLDWCFLRWYGVCGIALANSTVIMTFCISMTVMGVIQLRTAGSGERT